ncbi:MAG: PD-(D/E)XK nuclease family protein [Planctomycetota bacterium]
MSNTSNITERHFLGWDEPLLDHASAWIGERFQSAPQAWSQSLIVLPTARSRRRFELGLKQSLPACRFDAITVGKLPERLLPKEQSLASPNAQLLTWMRVLRECGLEELWPLTSSPPVQDALDAWLDLAGVIKHIHEELAIEGLSPATVADHLQDELPSESKRWIAIEQLLKRYQAELSSAGLEDPHLARKAMLGREPLDLGAPLILVGTADLPKMIAEMIGHLVSPVHCLVASPIDCKDGFDSLGRIEPGFWLKSRPPLRDDQILRGDDTFDQCERAAGWLNERAKDDVVIGATDETYFEPLELAIEDTQADAPEPISTFRQSGRRIERTSFARLLNLVGEYLRDRRYDQFAALVRHSVIRRYLDEAFGQLEDPSNYWLTKLDRLIAEHLPRFTNQSLPTYAIERFDEIPEIVSWVEDWIKPISGEQLDLSQFASRLRSWMSDLEGLDADFALARQVYVEILDCWCQEAQGRLKCSSATAFQILQSQVQSQRVVGNADPNTVHLIGWLDLGLDTAKSMLVLGLNHPFVPEAIGGDAFLPGNLRRELGMPDNDRRMARDLYAMHLMLCGRDDVAFMVGRRSFDGAPTPPSRLIAAADSDDVARRVRILQSSLDPVEYQESGVPETTSAPIPALQDWKTIRTHAESNDVAEPLLIPKRVSVTAFREYLECPYRFYLRRVLKASPLSDDAHELAANQFGDLVHNSLEIFGRGPHRDSDDAGLVAKVMEEVVEGEFERLYGSNVSRSVLVQKEQAVRRLRAFADVHAARARDGWVVREVESSVGEDHPIIIGSEPHRIGVTGRFDRIDFHPASGRYAILDYKTHAHPPAKKHLKGRGADQTFVDLQLPLYRRLIPHLVGEVDRDLVDIGYFNVASKVSDTKINLAEFSAEQWAQADDLIDECIRGISQGHFEPSIKPPEYDDYAVILQTSIFAGSGEVEIEEVRD